MTDLKVHVLRSEFEENELKVKRKFYIFSSDEDRAGFCVGARGFHMDADNAEMNRGKIPENLYIQLDQGQNTTPREVNKTYIVAFTDDHDFVIERGPHCAFRHAFGMDRGISEVKEDLKKILCENPEPELPRIKLSNHLELQFSPNKGFGEQGRLIFDTLFSNYSRISFRRPVDKEMIDAPVTGYNTLLRIFKDTKTGLTLSRR